MHTCCVTIPRQLNKPLLFETRILRSTLIFQESKDQSPCCKAIAIHESTTLRLIHVSLRSRTTTLLKVYPSYPRVAFHNGCSRNVGVELARFSPCSTTYMTFNHGWESAVTETHILKYPKSQRSVIAWRHKSRQDLIGQL